VLSGASFVGRGVAHAHGRKELWVSIVLAACFAVSGCGGGAEPAVQIEGNSISGAQVAHWAALERESPSLKGTPRDQALGYLIEVAWLKGEAKKQGAEPTMREVTQQIASIAQGSGQAREGEVPYGAQGMTKNDVELEAAARASWRRIEAALLAHATQQVGDGEVARYYHSHLGLYTKQEQRFFDIQNFHTETEALVAKSEVMRGEHRFHDVALHETLARATGITDKPSVEEAIFSAALHKLKGPIPLEPTDYHSIFEVTQAVPATVTPLAAVQARIRADLARMLAAETLREQAATWARSWKAATSCRPRYVVPECRESRVSETAGGPFSASVAFGVGQGGVGE
jgi:hypothetical protein